MFSSHIYIHFMCISVGIVQGQRVAKPNKENVLPVNSVSRHTAAVKRDVGPQKPEPKKETGNPGAWRKGKGRKNKQHALRVANYLNIMREQYAEVRIHYVSVPMAFD
jgi:hypothetical protein